MQASVCVRLAGRRGYLTPSLIHEWASDYLYVHIYSDELTAPSRLYLANIIFLEIYQTTEALTFACYKQSSR